MHARVFIFYKLKPDVDRDAFERRARDVEAALRLAEAALVEARQAIRALRTGAVAWDEFAGALRALAREFAQNHDVVVEVAAGEAGPVLPAELQADLARVLHEACANAVRHGGAGRIAVAAAASAGQVELRVRDDGRGFDPAAPTDAGVGGTGVGLRSMTERLERHGGTLTVESASGRGTTVRALVPLPEAR
jgi:signal transduction histidine kinase